VTNRVCIGPDEWGEERARGRQSKRRADKFQIPIRGSGFTGASTEKGGLRGEEQPIIGEEVSISELQDTSGEEGPDTSPKVTSFRGNRYGGLMGSMEGTQVISFRRGDLEVTSLRVSRERGPQREPRDRKARK